MHRELIGSASLICDDVVSALRGLDDNSFDLAIADPPYGASTTGTWKAGGGDALQGMGGAWQLADHEWDLLARVDGFPFALAWLAELKRVVRPAGSVWLHATYHNAGVLNVACQVLGLEIINEVVWYKRNAFPNLSARRLTASHETLLWVHTGGRKREYRFNYEDAKAAAWPGDGLKAPGKQLRTVWDVPNNKAREELAVGKHPTQKPLRLTERLFLVAGTPGGALLVPFMGSGTEVVAGLRYGMVPLGIELDPKWFSLATQRVSRDVAQFDGVLGP